MTTLRDRMKEDYARAKAAKLGVKHEPVTSIEEPAPVTLFPIDAGFVYSHDLIGMDQTEYYKMAGDPFPVRVYEEDHFDPEVRAYIPHPKEEYFYRKEFFDFLLMVEMGLKGALVGEASTGKDEMVKQVAALKRQPYRRITGDRRMTSDMIVGRRTMENGNILWEPGELQLACTYGCMVAIAEPWAMPPDTMFAMQSMMERDGYLSIVEHPDPSMRMLKVNADTKIILTTNTRGFGDDNDKFAATGVMDASFLNRLEYMQTVPHLLPEVEAKVISNMGVDEDIANNMVRLGNMIRQGWRTGTIEASWGLRNLMPWAEVYLKVRSISRAFKLTYWGKLNDNEKGIVTRLWNDCAFKETL